MHALEEHHKEQTMYQTIKLKTKIILRKQSTLKK